MKKYINLLAIALVAALAFTSCDVETKEAPGGTAVEKMAGNWDVNITGVDDAGNEVVDFGEATIYTYNTVDNSASKMWLDDQDTFWAFKFKVDVNYDQRSFSCAKTDYDAAGTGTAVVTDGKVLEGKATNLHGMPNDSIVFYVDFDDAAEFYEAYGFSKFKVSGQRHTGFYE
ncbi:MAG: lipid-binding protein [Bacteroidales bacterium]|nr:lipid-binding protein [Bacteroidales bacterium]